MEEKNTKLLLEEICGLLEDLNIRIGDLQLGFREWMKQDKEYHQAALKGK